MSIFSQSSRRSFFTNAGLIGALGALPGGQRIAAAMAAKATQESMKVYTRLGLRPIINASGTYTHLGGSLLPEVVIDAMNDAAKHYVPIRDLVKATGNVSPSWPALLARWSLPERQGQSSSEPLRALPATIQTR